MVSIYSEQNISQSLQTYANTTVIHLGKIIREPLMKQFHPIPICYPMLMLCYGRFSDRTFSQQIKKTLLGFFVKCPSTSQFGGDNPFWIRQELRDRPFTVVYFLRPRCFVFWKTYHKQMLYDLIRNVYIMITYM